MGGLLLFSAAWLTFWFAGVNPHQAWPAFAAIGTAAVLWMLRTWVESSHRFLLPPVTWAIAAFFGYTTRMCHGARVP